MEPLDSEHSRARDAAQRNPLRGSGCLSLATRRASAGCGRGRSWRSRFFRHECSASIETADVQRLLARAKQRLEYGLADDIAVTEGGTE
jgi:hypothetical protein